MAEDKKIMAVEGDELVATQTELMQKNVGRELVEKAVSGDEAAFEELYMHTYRYVYAVAKYYLSDDEDIRDAIQDTFARVYKHIGKLNDPSAFAWWLRTIAENCSKTIYSRKEKESGELTDLEDKIISHEDPLKEKDVSLDITEVLEAMNPDEAELLTRIYYDKMTAAEIARLQGLAQSTVRSRVKAAEKHLRELLRVRGIDKPFYGGEFVAMITTSFRNAIGTDLLSATVAQEILNNVRGGDEKRGAVITAVAQKERNKAVLRLASIMVSATLFFTLIIFGAYAVINRISGADSRQQTAENGKPDMSFWDKFFIKDTSSDDSSSSNTDTSHTSSQESSSTESPSSSGGSSSGSESFISSDSPSSDSSSGVNHPTSSNTGSTASGNSSSADNTVFVADCLPEQYNTLGRGIDNKFIATQGDWLYTAIGHITNFNNNDGLWKVKKDGSGRTKLTGTSASQINAVGEYLYFLAPNGKITKIRTDGKNQTQLSDLYAQNLTVVGNFAYFGSYGTKNYGTKCKYYKMNLTTLETEVLIEDITDKNMYWIAEDRLFIIDSEKGTISRFYPDTKTEELWYSNVDYTGVATGKYFVSDEIYDLSTKRTPISFIENGTLGVINNTFYYVENGREKLYIHYEFFDETLYSRSNVVILDLASMSFTNRGFSFDSELYVNGYSYSNIYDGYVYAHNDDGFFMRTKIGGNDFLMYN